MSHAPRKLLALAFAALVTAAVAGVAAGAEAVPWILRSGDLLVGERTFLFGLGVKGREAPREQMRTKAGEQLERLRGRLLLAAGAVRRGLDQDPLVQGALSRFRAEHLSDLFRQERVIDPARAAAKEAGGGAEAEAANFKREQNRRYRKLTEAAAKELPAEILATSLPAAGAGENPVVARVAGAEVRADEVRRGLGRVAHPDSHEETGSRVYTTVLDSLLAAVRFTALAEREGFAARPEFVDAFEDRRLRLLAERYAQTVIYPAVQVTDAEIEKEYARSRESLRRGEEREIYEILVADEQQARAVAGRLAAGMSFADAVREFSVGPTKEQAGFVGFLMRREAHPALDGAIAALGPGQTSPPVKTPFGWHILRCERIVKDRVPPIAEVRARLERSLTEAARAAALAAETARLAAEVPVEVNEKRYKEILESL